MHFYNELPSLYQCCLSIFLIIFTISTYQFFSFIQMKTKRIWMNPMLCSIAFIIPVLLYLPMSFDKYYNGTQWLTSLLEPAVVALGFPLYQQLSSIRHQWKAIMMLLALGVLLVISISFILSMLIIALPAISVSISLKSITTPIGIALSEQLNGDSSITAFAIILAGLIGATLGPSWLNFIKVTSPEAQGLAIGSASHAIGTAAVSKLSYEHGAYSSLALIVSAILTALISPILISLFFALLK